MTRGLFVETLTLAALFCATTSADDATAAPSVVRLTKFLELPDAHGVGGPIGGSHGKTMILAGGANFPDGPPWSVSGRAAGKKVWHDRTYWLQPGMSKLSKGPRLPYPLAYAPAVSTPHGVYVLGGETWSEEEGNHDVAEVLRIRFDARREGLVVERNGLPPLPRPCSYHAAGLVGSTVFVAASFRRDDMSRLLDEAALWSLDLAAPVQNRRWVVRPPWPGPPRHKMAAAVTRGPSGTSGERFYLVSGSTWFENDKGEHDLSRFRYFDDAYAFDPAANEWTTLARLPRLPESREIDTSGYTFDTARRAWTKRTSKPARDGVRPSFDDAPRPAAAASAVGGDGLVLVLSRSTGRYVTMDVRDRPPFPRELLAYDVDEDRWSVAGRMPTAVVTTTLFAWNGRNVLASGEVRPGVRTRSIWTFPRVAREPPGRPGGGSR